MRELTAAALAALVKYDTEHFASFILENLIPRTLSSDLCMRHGATLAAAEVTLALHQCGYTLPKGLFSLECTGRYYQIYLNCLIAHRLSLV